jgi:histone H3/H4
LIYLPASLVKSSFAEFSRVGLIDWLPKQPFLPLRRDIPTQRIQASACEWIEYVAVEFIECELRL